MQLKGKLNPSARNPRQWYKLMFIREICFQCNETRRKDLWNAVWCTFVSVAYAGIITVDKRSMRHYPTFWAAATSKLRCGKKRCCYSLLPLGRLLWCLSLPCTCTCLHITRFESGRPGAVAAQPKVQVHADRQGRNLFIFLHLSVSWGFAFKMYMHHISDGIWRWNMKWFRSLSVECIHTFRVTVAVTVPQRIVLSCRYSECIIITVARPRNKFVFHAPNNTLDL